MNERLVLPESLKRLQTIALFVGVIGLLLSLVGAFLDQQQFWQSYLLAYSFWLQAGLGSLGLLMLHHLVGGRWSALIRRLLESGALTLLPLAVLFLPLLVGGSFLYPWMNAEHIQESPLLQSKAAYLNTPFFLSRAVLYFAVWIVLALLFNRWSLAEDKSGDPALTGRMRRLSALGMILFMLTTTFAAYDWLMSLEPEWFSSIYGLLFIIGSALAALALALIGLNNLASQNGLQKEWAKSFNDLGNFLLAFVMTWAYFSFSQFLIIWSANIPEEAVWYAHRIAGGWQNVGIGLIACHFLLPFFLLLSRQLKRRAQMLSWLSGLILVMRLVDLYWLIVPAFYPDGIHIHWLDLTLVVAIGSCWIWFFIEQWSTRAPLPKFDPRLGVSNESHEKLATV